MSNLNLANNRQLAAFASQGISNDIIYQKFCQILNEFNLKGDLLDFGAGVGKLTHLIHELGRLI